MTNMKKIKSYVTLITETMKKGLGSGEFDEYIHLYSEVNKDKRV